MPVVVRGELKFVDVDSLVITKHHEITPCTRHFENIVETTDGIWVSVSRKVLQIERPADLLEEEEYEEAGAEDAITTLYTESELLRWEEYSSFPSFMRSSSQRILNGACVLERCEGAAELVGTSYNMKGLAHAAEEQGVGIMQKLDPFEWVSAELTIIKDLMLTRLLIEYLAVMTSFVVAVILYGSTVALAALIHRFTLDWSRMKIRSRPRRIVDAMRLEPLIESGVAQD